MCVIITNFAPIGQSVAEIWPFRFFNMAAVRHIGFVINTLGQPGKTTWWSLSLSKIWLESMQHFRQRGHFNTVRVWLENAYSRPQNWGFRGF